MEAEFAGLFQGHRGQVGGATDTCPVTCLFRVLARKAFWEEPDLREERNRPERLRSDLVYRLLLRSYLPL